MISVIIPIYNTGKLLNRMLQSIQEQSYKEFDIFIKKMQGLHLQEIME